MNGGNRFPLNQRPANGASHRNPAPLGGTVKTRIERGEAYSSPEIYDVELTLLEALRREAAGHRIASLNVDPGHPGFGNEFLLLKLKIKYTRRNRMGGGESFLFSSHQFCIFTPGENREWPAPSISGPHPFLNDTQVPPGSIKEGWLLLEVPRNEAHPLLVFKRQNVDAVHGVWGSLWFSLE